LFLIASIKYFLILKLEMFDKFHIILVVGIFI